MKNSTIRVPGFSKSYLPSKIGLKSSITEDGFFTMKGQFKWQKEALEQLSGHRFRIVNAPTGSGKSLFCLYLTTEEIHNNPNLKVIISVPQTIIADGFRSGNLEFPNKKRFVHSISNQFDLLSQEGKINTKSMVKRAIEFLELPNVDGFPPIMLCSHMTLVKLYQKLEKKKKLNLLENTSTYIDESHHVRSSAYTNGDLDLNWLGEYVHCIHDMDNTSLTLVTATPYRGDRLSILTDDIKDDFVSFKYAFDEYLKNLPNLHHFSFNFLLYKTCPTEAIKELFKEKIGKTIIYIPHVCSKYSTGDKNKEVKKIIDTIKHPNSKIKEDENGIFHVKRDGKNVVILDLVDDSAKRKKKKEYIQKHAKSPDGPDVIIALGMFKEGANYVYADRSIIIGPRNSITEIVQIIGRLLRDVEGKDSINVFMLLPHTFESTNKNFQDNLNDYLKAVYASMLLENVMFPCLSEKRKKSKTNINNGTAAPKVNSFNDLEVDDQVRMDIFDKIVKTHLNDRIRLGPISRKKEKEQFEKTVRGVLKSYKIDNVDFELVANDIWGMLSRRTSQMLEGIDVSHIKIDLVKKGDPLGWLQLYISTCGIDTFDKIRECINPLKTIEEHVKDAEELARQNEGILPNISWLMENNHGDLVASMYKYPEKFKHIEKDKKLKTIEEHVKDAEELAKNNNDVLPSKSLLRKNGHNDLAVMIWRFPDKFRHINQDKKLKTIEEWVTIAERLENEHNGLPSTPWLRKEKLTALIGAITTYPGKFKHIRRKSGRKTLDEYVKDAEELSKQNNGKMQSPGWLRKNGRNGLYQAMRRCPKKFEHIKQKKERKTLEEHVKDAEELAKENGGELQNPGWLRKNGHGDLYDIMHRCPDRFTNIKQKRLK